MLTHVSVLIVGPNLFSGQFRRSTSELCHESTAGTGGHPYYFPTGSSASPSTLSTGKPGQRCSWGEFWTSAGIACGFGTKRLNSELRDKYAATEKFERNSFEVGKARPQELSWTKG